MALPVHHLSHSQLNLMRDCMRALEYRYVLNRPRRTQSANAANGQTVHRTSAADLGERIAKGLLLPDEAIQDLAADAWQQETFLVDWRLEEAQPGKAKDEAISMARAHHRECAPRISPVAVEFEMSAPVAGLPVSIVGYADVVSDSRMGVRVVHGESEKRVLVPGRHVRDTKTQGKAPPGANDGQIRIDTRHQSQLVTYQILLAAMGMPTTQLWVDYCWPTKGGQAKSEPVEVTERDVRVVLEEYADLVRVYESGLFPRTGRGGWLCRPGKCDYYDECILGVSRATNL